LAAHPPSKGVVSPENLLAEARASMAPGTAPNAGSISPWSNLSATVTKSPSARDSPALVYDRADGFVLLFGGQGLERPVLGDSWKFDSGKWTLLKEKVAPPARYGAQITYDPLDGYVLLFGGFRSPAAPGFNDTWKFVGGSWTNLTPGLSVVPKGRGEGGLAYDPTDGYSVLFGGCPSIKLISKPLADTWTFAHGAWTDRTASLSKAPGARALLSLSADPPDHGLLLFGGLKGTTGYSDTWLFANGNWSGPLSASGPVARLGAAMGYDGSFGAVVLFGGQSPNGSFLADTWKFQGAAWAQLKVAGPSARYLSGFTFDNATAYSLLFGGIARSGAGVVFERESWAFRSGGALWANASTPTRPGARDGASLVYDPSLAKVVLFGGEHRAGSVVTYLNDTWTFSAGAWSRLNSLSAPSPRAFASATFDARASELLIVGGTNGTLLNDTWVLSGRTWSPVASASAPSPRSAASMAYSDSMNASLLFGGQSATGPSAETWEFTASGWQNLTGSLTKSPPARSGAAIVYYPSTGGVVLFGGAGAGLLGDTWQFAKGNWSAVGLHKPPSARSNASLVYDPASGLLYLFGGAGSANPLNDTWQYSRGSWTPLAPPLAPPGRSASGFVFDLYDHAGLLFGGSGASSVDLNDTWTLGG
ncbi:MAG: kelch repeat-containing protein, partial [Candidatus Lutacidiplasmatales archaeon]